METARTLVGGRWWWKTLVVLLAMGVMVGLGLWQLDRLEQRRTYNAQTRARLEADPLVIDGDALPRPPGELQNRRATARGVLDYEHQVSIKNQTFQGQPGVVLVTPLRIEGSERGILVNRGWLPYQETDPAGWAAYDEAMDGVELVGYLQPSRKRPNGTTSAIPDDTRAGWFRLDIEAIQSQVPYALLPVVLQLAPESGRDPQALPRRIVPDLELSEGNHFSYALQWFSFALIAAIVYIAVVRREEEERAGKRSLPPVGPPPELGDAASTARQQ